MTDDQSGPGDVELANQWFTRPRDPRDRFASPPLLHEMDIALGDTRFIQSDAVDFGVWVAKKPDGSLCLLGTYAGMGYGTCASAEDFAKHGLWLGQHHATVRWDGRSITVSTIAPSIDGGFVIPEVSDG